MPATGNSFPVTSVVLEICGVHEHITDMRRRFPKIERLAIYQNTVDPMRAAPPIARRLSLRHHGKQEDRNQTSHATIPLMTKNSEMLQKRIRFLVYDSGSRWENTCEPINYFF